MVVWDPNPARFCNFERLRWYKFVFWPLGLSISQQLWVIFFERGPYIYIYIYLTYINGLATIIGADLTRSIYEPEEIS